MGSRGREGNPGRIRNQHIYLINEMIPFVTGCDLFGPITGAMDERQDTQMQWWFEKIHELEYGLSSNLIARVIWIV